MRLLGDKERGRCMWLSGAERYHVSTHGPHPHRCMTSWRTLVPATAVMYDATHGVRLCEDASRLCLIRPVPESVLVRAICPTSVSGPVHCTVGIPICDKLLLPFVQQPGLPLQPGSPVIMTRFSEHTAACT
jgi:hypothetical protein